MSLKLIKIVLPNLIIPLINLKNQHFRNQIFEINFWLPSYKKNCSISAFNQEYCL